MAQDKYNSIWVSHSSINDFLKCPRAYFLHNVYRTKDNRKINLVDPSLSLGQAVHETLEGLAKYRAEERFLHPMEASFEENWKKVSGKRGGFKSQQEEYDTKERAKKMIMRVAQNPGPLLKKTLKIKSEGSETLPNFYLSAEENIILCGKIDWVEYVDEDDSVRIIDFKTGKNNERQDSLQMPIYILFLDALQKRKVSGASYWYLDREDVPSSVALPKVFDAREKVLSITRRIKSVRENGHLECPRGPARLFCLPTI